MKEILQCAKGFQAALYVFATKIIVDMLFDICINGGSDKTKPRLSQVLIEGATSNTISAILAAIYDNLAYRTCINQVNLNWKSQMGLLLSEMIDD